MINSTYQCSKVENVLGHLQLQPELGPPKLLIRGRKIIVEGRKIIVALADSIKSLPVSQ